MRVHPSLPCLRSLDLNPEVALEGHQGSSDQKSPPATHLACFLSQQDFLSQVFLQVYLKSTFAFVLRQASCQGNNRKPAKSTPAHTVR